MSDEKLKEAKKLVDEAEKKKQEECKKELDIVLEKFGYDLRVAPTQMVLVKIKE